jgi:hypothetical protein
VRILLGLLLPAYLLISGSVAAAQSSPQELGEAVIRESGAEGVLIQSVENMGPVLIQSFRANIPDLTEPEGDLIMAYFVEEIRVLMPDFVSEVGAVYAENFTAEELQDILDFYRSPTGQKLNERLPVLTQAGQAVGERLGERAMNAAMPRIVELLENR